MTTLAVNLVLSHVVRVNVTDDTITVELDDGRTVSVPTAWYPRLLYASEKERKDWRLIGKGHGVHWEALDEDISIKGILIGKPSGESQSSFKKWLNSRKKDHGIS